jgi:hypothetical protein
MKSTRLSCDGTDLAPCEFPSRMRPWSRMPSNEQPIGLPAQAEGRTWEVGPGSVTVRGDIAILSFQVSDRALWFEVPALYADFLCTRTDAALVALLAPAYASGTALVISGETTARLAFQVEYGVKALLRSLLPDAPGMSITWQGSLCDSSAGNGDAVLTGLSGGVDSLTACHNFLLDDSVPDSMRITHFLFNDVGSHSQGDRADEDKLFSARLAAARELSNELGVPLIPVRTNLGDFDPAKFVTVGTLRNAAVALALQSKARLWLYASAYHMREASIVPGDIAHADWMLLPMLTTNGLEMQSTGGHLTRSERTHLLSQVPSARQRLNVCVRNSTNCSTCWKCARTLLTLELLGEAAAFSGVFDLQAFAKVRSGFIAHMLAGQDHDPMLAEVVALWRARGGRQTPGQFARVQLATLLAWLAEKPGGWRFRSAYAALTGFNPRVA